VWYLNDLLQEAAQFEECALAETWAEDVRQMLTA